MRFDIPQKPCNRFPILRYSRQQVPLACARGPNDTRHAAMPLLGSRNSSLDSPPVSIAMVTWVGIAAAGGVLLSVGAEIRSICVAPLVEEIVFRWGLQDALSARLVAAPRWTVPLLTAAAFSLAHLAFVRDAGDVPRAVATLLPAWWIGWHYENGGRHLGPCVAWHAAFNLAWLCGLGTATGRWLPG